ncbi:hypothetical protein ACIQPR_45985 [Streptomyces sp. NPDC091280]|uniref:hypothetical protein n=1 Tax=Streptomyces sp. NPDC091280 TaxID=3365984 RepID=UPI0038024DE8
MSPAAPLPHGPTQPAAGRASQESSPPPPDHSLALPSELDEALLEKDELARVAGRLSWQQRAGLSVLARCPCRIRQRADGRLYVDTHSSSLLPIRTWQALERKGLVHRDHAAHPASALGQRLALTPRGLAVLSYRPGKVFPLSATRLWPPAPPAHLTAAPRLPAHGSRAIHR